MCRPISSQAIANHGVISLKEKKILLFLNTKAFACQQLLIFMCEDVNKSLEKAIATFYEFAQ